MADPRFALGSPYWNGPQLDSRFLPVDMTRGPLAGAFNAPAQIPGDAGGGLMAMGGPVGPQPAPQAAPAAAMPLGPSMAPNAAPAAPQPAQPRYMMGGAFGDFLRNNNTAIQTLAAGLLSGSRRGLSGAVGSLPQAQAMDRQNAAMGQLTQGLDPKTAALARAFPQLYAQQAFAQPDMTDDMREFNYARANGFNGSLLDWLTAQRRAGASSTNVNVDTAGNSFAKGLGQGLSDEFLERRAAANEAVQSLASIGEARRLLDAGMITGFGANFKVGLGKALQQAGFNYATDEVANTEAFVAAQAKEVGRIISLFGAGTGLSDKDREFAMQAAAGNIEMTEATIRRILDINERASRNVIQLYNEDASRIPPGMSPYPLTVDAPAGGWTDVGGGVRIREKR